jgi:hypothetical protein
MIRSTIRTVILSAAAIALTVSAASAQMRTSSPFAGAKANKGTVSYAVEDGKGVLTLSSDFVVPDTPDPHWQVIDSRGQVFLLQRLPIKNALGVGKDRINMSITLPSYIQNVSKVQIYCSWAEAVLGEASFATPQSTN